MGHFSIGDLEQLSGIKAHTIRMWEQRYGLLNPVRSATNIRMYCDDDLRRLLNVTTLCGRGQRISQVAKLTDAEISEAVLACCDDSHDYHRQVNALLAALVRRRRVAQPGPYAARLILKRDSSASFAGARADSLPRT